MFRFPVIALLALLGSAVQAHQPQHSKLRAVIDPLPAELQGMIVQIHETLAPQLVVENRTRHTLEILDDKNRAFIRIGPGGVEGDHNAPAWYQTFSTAPMAVPESARQADAAARWLTVRSDPTWGWFDPRLHAADTAGHGPGEAASGKRPPKVRTGFEIPLRIDGKAVVLRGRFEPKIVLAGRYDARLDPAAPRPPGLGITVVQGSPPALLLRNTSSTTVTVLGLKGEPYLRIGPQGVEANVVADTWRLYGRGRAAAVMSADAAPQWQRLSPQPLYTWLEPRAEVELSKKPPARRGTVKRWQVPLLLGDQPYTLKGLTDWVPDAAQAD